MYKIPAKTLFFGKNLIYVSECHSTNDLAWELVKSQKAGEGAIIVTDYQTAGRGQRGNAWEAAAGLNLTFSLVLKPTFLAPNQHFALNMFTSLAVLQALAEAGVTDLHVKWPNDVMSGTRKIVGILVENTVQANHIVHTVAGIGVNVNQEAFEAPTATSIKSVTGAHQDLSDMLNRVTARLESGYLKLKQHGLAALQAEYLANLYWRNEQRSFLYRDTPIEGIIRGVDEFGRLCIDTNGATIRVDLKEIKYIA